jgi:hypothetical protein
MSCTIRSSARGPHLGWPVRALLTQRALALTTLNAVTRHLEDTSMKLRLGMALTVAYPWLWLGSVYTTWVVARVSLGRSPRPLLDDPKSTAHSVSVALLMLLLPIGFSSILAGVWLGASRRLHWNAVGTWLSALVLSWLVAVLYGRMDPGSVLAWFVD